MFPDGSVCDDYNFTRVTYTKCLHAVNHTNQLTHASIGNALKRLESSSFVVCDRENNVKFCVLSVNLFQCSLFFFCLDFKAKNEVSAVSQINRASGSKL